MKNGYDKTKYNRIANFVHLKNDINVSVSDAAPNKYLSNILSGDNNHHSDIASEKELADNFNDNAIPQMLIEADADDYADFLRQRQRLMAQMLREYYESL